jgi:phage baseplate assembly protein V
MIDLDLLAGLLASPDHVSRFYGVVVGVVTNIDDQPGLGRVKVTFPWLSDDNESDWVRVVAPMAGKDRGIYFLPEVDDEVLVAFEHGLVERPYVLGALWSEKNKPPEPYDQGKNNRHTIKSRSGHIVRLDDSAGKEKIEIVDKSGKNSITISTADNTIAIIADADITITSRSGKLKLNGNGVEITSQAEVTIKATKDMSLTGKNININ